MKRHEASLDMRQHERRIRAAAQCRSGEPLKFVAARVADAFTSAAVEDAASIAALFTEVYNRSTHPCQAPEFVRESIEGGSDAWIVLKDSRGVVVACSVLARLSWWGVYETCRMVAHPRIRGRGIAPRLYAATLHRVQELPGCKLIYGQPRQEYMRRLVCDHLSLPVRIVGHDGAANCAAGRREFHLQTLRFNPWSLPCRSLPPPGSPAARVCEGLGCLFDGPVSDARYPKAYVVAPQDPVRDASWATHPPHGASATLSSLEASDAGAAIAETQSRMAHLSAVRHIAAYVLADKHEYIAQMASLCFVPTAYLPGWYAMSGVHFDCVLLVRRWGGEEPVSLGIEADLTSWDRRLCVFQPQESTLG